MIKKFAKCLLNVYRKVNLFVDSRFDKHFLATDVPTPRSVNHESWQEHLFALGNRPNARVLEIGSREVSFPGSYARKRFDQAEYVGFDYYPGKNVDVVGDAHRLSTYFDSGEKFDLIFTHACFEHFAMPWVVAIEIAKLLKVGGHVFVETHFSFSSHERPWHFFHFSDMALRVLFSEALGFECIEAGVSNPIVGRFSSLAAPYLRNRAIAGMYCHSEFLGRKIREPVGFDWQNVELDKLIGDTKYPAPQVA